MVRCFIGIVLPENIRDEVVAVQNELKKLPIDCKFVENENLHISLSFLGEVEENKIDGIKQKLTDIGGSITKFNAVIHGLKLIPNERYIRVIALDVFDEQKMLIALSKMIQQKIGGDAKPSHITLCRIKNIANKPLFFEKMKNLKINISGFVVDKVYLIKSELRRQGPVYSILSETSLG